MRILFICLIFSLGVNAQSFTFKTKLYANGNLAPMKGVPGDLFMATLTFSNSSTNDISVFINRYQKSIPAYWRSCYCFTVCSDPSTDTIRITVPALNSIDITVQFKTDSVNPGLATSKFTIYQIGFPNNSKELDLSATTLQVVGLNELTDSRNIHVFPNPSSSKLIIQSDQTMKDITLRDANGRLVFCALGLTTPETQVDVSTYTKGIYFLEVLTEHRHYTKVFVKE